uniref:G-protein coupled receptors family 1 profile domain-containing protein n=1 Tax=Leptobrachium leishanense TaxID=445787 RepID=A0A8C5P6K9_9ANUR
MEVVTNTSSVEDFWMLGFENIHSLKGLLFCIFLISYIVTLSGNITIISVVSMSRCCHSPMYFFLGHLSVNDIIISTNVVPGMLCIVLNEGSSVSLGGCFTQIFFLSQSAVTECLLLTVMSYDRYVAICNPLRYSSFMDLQLCSYLVGSCWVFGILSALPHNFILMQMTFCGSNMINHFYCDLIPVLAV